MITRFKVHENDIHRRGKAENNGMVPYTPSLPYETCLKGAFSCENSMLVPTIMYASEY